MMLRARFAPRKDGVPGCRVRLPEGEREVLRTIPSELLDVLSSLGDTGTAPESARGPEASAPPGAPEAGERSMAPTPPSLRRLFPPAYSNDDEAEATYAASTRADLISHHIKALQQLASSADATVLTEEQMHEWLGAMNDVRLVLGTVLDMSEDAQGTSWNQLSPQEWVYHYLGLLQTELLECLSRFLPPPTPGADDEVPSDPWGEPIGGLRWDGTPQPEQEL
jgi:hypothetical protein